uniref:Uncharacterized protein n=2 Tax=Aegilops tauschii subsp. strangulata TaxID=200361 RepID=A0A453I3D4_AEGTS
MNDARLMFFIARINAGRLFCRVTMRKMPQPIEIGCRFHLCLLLHPQAAEHSYSKAGDQDAATKEILEPAQLIAEGRTARQWTQERMAR